MKTKSTTLKRLFIAVDVLLLVGFILNSNQMAFGVWSPLDVPTRINIDGRTYHRSQLDPISFKGAETPAYAIKNWEWTGKKLVAKQPIEEDVTVIYLKLSNGKYQAYALSGSN